MLLNLIIAGVGGQGNVLASQIIGHAAVSNGYHVTIGETFGLSQRGGPVLSHIRISDKKEGIGPLIPPHMADVIVGIEPLESLRVLKEFGHFDTITITNARPIYPVNVIAGDAKYPSPEEIKSILEKVCKEVYWMEATEMAIQLGDPIFLNVIMLGALCSLPIVPIFQSDLLKVIKVILPASKLHLNEKAFEIGGNAIAC